MKDRNFTHGPNSGAAIAIPAIILLAIIAAIVAMNSSCSAPKAVPSAAAPRATSTPAPLASPSPARRPIRPMTDGNSDPLERPEWFKKELSRIEAGIDESQLPPEERGRKK